MTQVLLAAVILLGIAVAADLALTFAVVRRLAAVEDAAASAGPAVPERPPYPDQGFRVGDFTARLLDGSEVDRSVLADTFATVLFLLPHCEPCKKLIASIRGGVEPAGSPVVAFVIGAADSPDVHEVAASLPAGVRVGAVSDRGSVATAFGVGGSYPVMLRLDDAVVVGAGTRYEALPDRTPAGLPQ